MIHHLLDDALDAFDDAARHPFPPRWQHRARLLGIVAALRGDDLVDRFRFTTDQARQRWDAGFTWTNRATCYFFATHDCVMCGARVGGAGPLHAYWCRQWQPHRHRWTVAEVSALLRGWVR